MVDDVVGPAWIWLQGDQDRLMTTTPVVSQVPIASSTPLIPRFMDAYPNVTLDITLSDTVNDLIDEPADIAIRVGPMRDSSPIARRLGTSRMVVVAAPDDLARYGTPTTPADLADHRWIG